MKVAYHKSRLKAAYLHWRRLGDDLDCGLHMARVIRGPAFSRAEERCMNHAAALRELGQEVPPVPGEAAFR